jgi:hypothetical protein
MNRDIVVRIRNAFRTLREFAHFQALQIIGAVEINGLTGISCRFADTSCMQLRAVGCSTSGRFNAAAAH